MRSLRLHIPPTGRASAGSSLGKLRVRTKTAVPTVFAVLVGWVALTAAGTAEAAENGGTRSVFAEGADLRALGMGGAFTAVGGSLASLDWNPAGLAGVSRTQFSFGRTSYFGEEIGESHVAGVLPSWRWGSVALGIRHFGVQGIESRDSRNQVLDDGFSSNQLQASLAYARPMGDSWSVGATGKFRREQLGDFSANGLGLDVGARFHPATTFDWDSDWAHGLSLGASWVNFIEPEIRLEQDNVVDPSAFRIGMALERTWIGGSHLVAALDLESSSPEGTQLRTGAEWTLHPMLSLRTGVGGTGSSIGAGVHWQDFDVDYAFEDRGLGSVHRIGLSYELGATTSERRLQFLEQQESQLQARLERAFQDRQEERIVDLIRVAEEARKAGDLDEALSVIDVALTLAPEREGAIDVQANIYFDQGVAMEKKNRLSEASLAFGRVLSLRTDDKDAAEAKARVDAESSRRAARAQGIREAFADAMDSFAEGDWGAAKSGFEKVIAASPKDEEAKAMLRRTEGSIDREFREVQANIPLWIGQGRYRQAAESIAKLRSVEGDTPRLMALLTQLNSSKSRAIADATSSTSEPGPVSDPAPTVEKTRTAPRMSATELEDLYRRGMQSSQNGRSADAIRFFELVFADAPNYAQVRENLVREYLTVGMEQFAAGKLEEAIDLWTRAVDADPGNAKAQGYLERAQRHRSRAKEIRGGSDE